MEMSTNPHPESLGIPPPSEKDHQPFIDLITMAIDWPHKHKNAPPHITDSEADLVIYISFLISETEWWSTRFKDSQKNAARFYRDPATYWRTIAMGVSNPKVLDECKKLLPSLDPEKYLIETPHTPAPKKITHQVAPASISEIQETPEETKPELPRVKKRFSLKIAMRLCVAWMLDPRWEKLSPCAKLLFFWLVFRTYRKDTILKIKQALARGETYFPWCLTGIKSLSKQLTYRPGSSKKVNHYGERQIKKALRQLWDLGFVHRIFRGYEEQGAGKYHVFLNPKMSATFNQARVKTKQGITPKKKRSRMS